MRLECVQELINRRDEPLVRESAMWVLLADCGSSAEPNQSDLEHCRTQLGTLSSIYLPTPNHLQIKLVLIQYRKKLLYLMIRESKNQTVIL